MGYSHAYILATLKMATDASDELAYVSFGRAQLLAEVAFATGSPPGSCHPGVGSKWGPNYTFKAGPVWKRSEGGRLKTVSPVFLVVNRYFRVCQVEIVPTSSSCVSTAVRYENEGIFVNSKARSGGSVKRDSGP